MTRTRLWLAAGITLVVVVAAGVGIAVWWGDDVSSECQVTLDARERVRAEPLTDGSSTIAVLGDSYTQGTGLLGVEFAWPALLGEQLGAEVVVDGVGGTGFTTRGFCPDSEVTYGERLDDLPDAPVVIVQGGVNDALAGRPDDVAAAAEDLLGRLEDVPTVVVVGPPASPAAGPEEVAAVDAALRQAAADAGRGYVPLVDEGIELLDDQVHPTQAGHQRIAGLVAAALEAADEAR